MATRKCICARCGRRNKFRGICARCAAALTAMAEATVRDLRAA